MSEVEASDSTTGLAPDSTPAWGDVVGRDVLVARCQMLEQSVRSSGHISTMEIDAVRPGGPDNSDTSAHGWLYFLCVLHRMHERGPAVRTPSGSMKWDAQSMDAVRAALAAEPMAVRLTSGLQVNVHPKGEHALHRLVMLDKAMEYVASQRLRIEQQPGSPTTITALGSAVELQFHLERQFAAILTHEGAGIPRAMAGSAWDVEVPEWTATVEPYDILAMRRAHLMVNLARINEVSERTRAYAKGEGGALPIAAFLGLMATELHVQPRELSRNWSLGEVFAQALLKWEADERTKAEHKQKTPD